MIMVEMDQVGSGGSNLITTFEDGQQSARLYEHLCIDYLFDNTRAMIIYQRHFHLECLEIQERLIFTELFDHN